MSSLVSRVRLYLGGDAYLVNRLDRETSGVTVVAKSAVVARELGKLWETRMVTKEYAAIVHGHLKADQQLIDAPLGKDVNSRVAIKDCVRLDGAPAQTEVRVERRFVRPATKSDQAADVAKFSLLRVVPRSGRKHQIRIHLAHAGHSIVGDKLYGADEDLYLALVEDRLTERQREQLMLPYHALHAAELRFDWRGQEVRFNCEAEPWFLNFLTV